MYPTCFQNVSRVCPNCSTLYPKCSRLANQPAGNRHAGRPAVLTRRSLRDACYVLKRQCKSQRTKQSNMSKCRLCIELRLATKKKEIEDMVDELDAIARAPSTQYHLGDEYHVCPGCEVADMSNKPTVATGKGPLPYLDAPRKQHRDHHACQPQKSGIEYMLPTTKEGGGS